MYEKTEIDTAMESFISEAQKEFAPEPEETAPVVAQESAPQPDTALPNTAESEKPTTDPAERGLERLVAREMELRERENRLSQSSAEMEALRARVREMESRQISEDLLNKIRLSPNEGLRHLGLDPDEVVRQALVEKLGDKADTPEIREMLERNRLRREMESLKAQIQAQERERAAYEYYSKIASGANQFVRDTSGLEKHAPTVSQVAKSNPERVYSEIMEEIQRDAQVRMAREPNGDVISYEEAAKRVEKRWSDLKSLILPQNQPSTPSPTTPVAAKPSNPPPQTPNISVKPPEKPLAPWLQRNVDQEEALRLAIAEYNKALK